MNSFIKNLFSIFFLALGFFVFSGTSVADAQTNNCQITSLASRPPGWFTVNTYSDVTPPYIYLDIRTQNCDTQNGNILNILIKNIDVSILGGSDIEVYDLQSIKVRVKQNGSSSQQGGSVDFESTDSDFTIPLVVGERGNLGSCQSTPGLDDCSLVISIYNNSASGNPQLYTSSSLGIQYECDYICNLYWRLGCPAGQGVAPQVLPYGSPNICAADNSSIDITTHLPGSSNGGVVIQGGEYSTEPLAPLPGFTGNPNLGQWLESLFTILIVVAGILAFIMIIVGGLTYLTSESFGEKGKGKTFIQNSIFGLILALGAWVILNTINPNLAEDLNIQIPAVALSIGDANYWSSGAQTDSSGTITGYEPLPNIGLVCPMGGGSANVAQVIDSFVGKTTYRWGGKGGPLPAGGQFKLSPKEQSNGPYMCQNSSGESVECRSFCPDNSVCLDCSGFVNQVRRCTGLNTFAGTSNMVSLGIEIDINNLSSDGQSITIDGAIYTFVPGDILVWNGHVVIYYGNGIIAESAGATTTNTNIKKSPLSSYSGKNQITHLIKVNP